MLCPAFASLEAPSLKTLLAFLLLTATAQADRFGIEIAIAIAEAESAQQAAQAEKPKPKLWYRCNPSCKPCKAFENDKEIQEFIAEHFELVTLSGVVPDFQVEGRDRTTGFGDRLKFLQWLKDQHYERPSYESK